MALNKKRLNRTKESTKGGGGFYRFQEGRNIVRFFSFSHKVVQLDFDKGIYKQSDGIKVGETYDEIEMEVLKHYIEEGIVNCPKGDCKWCEDAEKLLSSKSKADKKAGKDIKASKSFCVNTVDIQSDSKAMQLGSLPSSVYDTVLSYICDPEYGESVLGSEGRDFIVDRDTNQIPAKMYVTKIRDKDKCEVLGNDYELQDLFYINALEPGYSSVDELNTFENEETEEEKKQRLKEEKAAAKKATKTKTPKASSKTKTEETEGNPFKDTDTSGGKLPWEGNTKFELKDIVSFEEKGETFKGYIVEIGDDIIGVQTGKKDSDIFDIPPNELTFMEKAKKTGGRRRK